MELIVIVLILVIFFLSSSLKIAHESERVVVFRLGRLCSIAGPGLVLVMPILDRGVKVDLGREIAGWQALSKEQLAERIRELPEIAALVEAKG